MKKVTTVFRYRKIKVVIKKIQCCNKGHVTLSIPIQKSHFRYKEIERCIRCTSSTCNKPMRFPVNDYWCRWHQNKWLKHKIYSDRAANQLKHNSMNPKILKKSILCGSAIKIS